MKKNIAFILTVCVLTSLFTISAVSVGNAKEDIVMYVDSSLALSGGEEKYIDDNRGVSPVVENGRTLVPVRFVAENLGMTVEYDEKDETVTLYNDKYTVVYKIGSNIMTVNGKERMIDPENSAVVAKTVHDRTLIPLRSLAEAIGKKVFYDRGLIIISDTENIYDPKNDKAQLDALISRINVLPKVGTAEYLEKLIGAENGGIYYVKGGVIRNTALAVTEDSAPATGNAPMPAPTPAPQQKSMLAESGSNVSDEYSKTNVQVEGVDEGDVVKTDGKYVYQINGQRIIIARVNPAEQMSITGIIKRDNEQFSPNEIYVDGDRLVVIATVYRYDEPVIYDSAEPAKANNGGLSIAPAPRPIMPPVYRNNVFTRCAVYNISDRSKPVLERTLEIEGNYLSSRKIGNIVYTVSNRWLSYVKPMSETAGVYRDNDKSIDIGYDRVCYFPGFTSANMLTIASIDITLPDKEAKVETMLGGGENVYVSTENMFIASSRYNQDRNTQETLVYKFSLNDGAVTYLCKGAVKGNILNQFSMDEYKGYFRIATTSYVGQEKNNLYILDDTMSQSGSIEGIAPGERIYSARFAGERGYMVTFRQVDPLFVIDLSDPHRPQILGNLKIPGYSDYIHPVDNNHIIGFGKDATLDGFYQGMKMALFDVSDVTKPIEKFNEIIGDRGTESALLRNHRALLWAPEKGILAFPVTVREVNKQNQYGTAYGSLTFSGAYVYDFSTENGFKLRGKISHLSAQDTLKLGEYMDYNKEISRILYTGDNLITTSNAKIQAHSIDTVQLKNEVEIPPERQY
ncbi:MAG: Beta propeller domain protein [Firmicutes bacterium ADurb.Bin193]|nr:MAG: Beta propeller domain protein [Firmicutes bacterium ADurb.Bin193]